MIDLRPCPGCRRHVAITERRCPFCAAAVPPSPSHPILHGRLSRAAVFASASLTACWTESSPPPATPVDHHEVHEHHAETGSASNNSVSADVTLGSIEGTATQAGTNSPVAGVLLHLSSRRPGKTQVVTTDARGHYVFANVEPGDYEVWWGGGPRAQHIPVSVQVGQIQHADIAIVPLPQNNRNLPMPYGAPPARARIV